MSESLPRMQWLDISLLGYHEVPYQLDKKERGKGYSYGNMANKGLN